MELLIGEILRATWLPCAGLERGFLMRLMLITVPETLASSLYISVIPNFSFPDL